MKYGVIKRPLPTAQLMRGLTSNPIPVFYGFEDEEAMKAWALRNPGDNFMPEFIRYETINLKLKVEVSY